MQVLLTPPNISFSTKKTVTYKKQNKNNKKKTNWVLTEKKTVHIVHRCQADKSLVAIFFFLRIFNRPPRFPTGLETHINEW